MNTTAPYSSFIGVNTLNNAIGKILTNNDDFSLKMNLKPYKLTKGVKSLENTVDGILLSMIITLAFSFIPASMAVFIIKEREINAKH